MAGAAPGRLSNEVMTSMTAITRAEAGDQPLRVAMTWVTWRQHRMVLAGAGGLLAACAAALGVTGLRMHAAYVALVAARCLRPHAPVTFSSLCEERLNALMRAPSPFTGDPGPLMYALSLIPVIIGVLAGAPLLAREYETGTARFAWTQAAGRDRWVITKLTLLGAALTAMAGALGTLVSWWLSLHYLPYGTDHWQPLPFGLGPVTLAGWSLLAFTLGVLAGTLTRQAVPAMAATALCVTPLLLFASRRLNGWLTGLFPVIGRTRIVNAAPYMIGAPPVSDVSGFPAVTSVPAGSWPLRSWVATARGDAIGMLPSRVQNLTPAAFSRWLAGRHLSAFTAYQPPGRFWMFQAAEGVAMLLLAVLAAVLTLWLVRRRAA